jgi:hypothetical protein
MSNEEIESFMRQLEKELNQSGSFEFRAHPWHYRLLSPNESREHQETMRQAAAAVVTLMAGDAAGLLETTKCVTPIMWDGATGYLAIEHVQPGRLVAVDFELLIPAVVISNSVESFLALVRDAIRSNREPDWEAIIHSNVSFKPGATEHS